MIELESWIDIDGYEGLYQVSSLGRVRSLDRGMYVRQDRYPNPRWVTRKGKILKIYYNSTDRQMVILYDHGVPKNHTVHRLVGEHFLPNPDRLPVMNHINSNHHDNRVANLEWCTYKYNIQHAIAAGRMNHIYKKRSK